MAISKKQKIAAAAVGGTIALYAVAGFYLLPAIASKQLPVLVAEKTGQQLRLQDIKFNPFSFRAELDGFSLSSPEGKNLLSFDALTVNIAALASLTGQAVVLDDILLRKPVVNVERLADGSFNFNRLIPKDEAPVEEKPDTAPLPLSIKRLAIEESQVVWQDLSAAQPQTETLLPLNLIVTDLNTNAAGDAVVDLGFGLASGGKLQWHGDLTLLPVSSKGNISLEEIVLPKVWQLFLQEILPVEITDGRLTVKTDYQASLDNGKLALTLGNGGVDIKQLEIAEKGKTDALLAIPSIALGGIAFDLGKQQVSIASLASNDAKIKAWLQADGRVNYQTFFAKDAVPADASAPTPPTTTTEPASPWLFELNELALNNYQLEFTDQTKPKPLLLKLSNIDFNLQKFSTRQNERLPLQFDAVFNDIGKLKIGGDMALTPFSANFAVDIKDVKLKTFQSYVDDYLNLELVDGDFNTLGNLQLAMAEDFQLGYQGDADIEDLITRDKVKNKDFVKWVNLGLQKIDINLAKQDFTLAKVVFDRPYVRFNIKKDGSTNINDIVVSQLAKPAAAEKTIESKPKTDTLKTEPVVTIGKIELKDGKSDFADNSLILPFVAEMNDLNGEVEGFSSKRDATAKLSLKGKVYDLALVGIKGNYQLQSGDSDIALNFTHMPLPLITPYMAEFAGYKIEKGQMALDLQYKIKQGRLEAKNKIFIDQLALGEHVENPNATSLPLHLAIALLKDSDGKINLDFPVTGSLDDPKFSVGSLIADVLVNMVTKVAMSPFHALGSLLDQDSDYSAVKFPAGSAELKAEETAKLEQLSKALQGKPELDLEIKGVAYQAQDWPVMRFDAVKDILKKMKSGELRDKGEKIRSEYIELSEDEYKRLLAKFFKEVFPNDIDYSLIGRPRIKAQPDADFYVVARQKLEAMMQPEPQRLNDLAVSRANSISKYLVEQGKLERGRVYILAPELDRPDTDGIASILSLNVTP